MLRAGRRSGKSAVGADAVLEELCIPGVKWWICGPTFRVLHDATMPTFLRRVPPNWVKHWSQDNLELILTNDSIAQFRSLHDPEAQRGQGLHGVWLDEAAFCLSRAWEVLEPSLAENAGVCIATTSPAGYDWTYHEFMKKALIDKEPGYWARRFKTIDNPLFHTEPQRIREVENARKTKSPEVFAAEYEGEDVNYTGAIYGMTVEACKLEDKESVKAKIGEWPNINADRKILIGLDSGADHPFGAVMIVVTDKGLVVVNEYLERQAAVAVHMAAIINKFGLKRFGDVTWYANKNEAQLRLEFGLRGIGVVQSENRHKIGIQRVQSWIHSGQFFIAVQTAPMTAEQMFAYRWAENYAADGTKKNEEDVFKKNDELPDGVRYVCMGFPELPKVPDANMTDEQKRRWEAFDDKTRNEIVHVREFNKKSTTDDLQPMEEGYPLGSFYNPYDTWY